MTIKNISLQNLGLQKIKFCVNKQDNCITKWVNVSPLGLDDDDNSESDDDSETSDKKETSDSFNVEK